MTFSDEDKGWLMEAIGGIVAGATTAIRQDVTSLRAELVSFRAETAERFDQVDERLSNQETDILAIRTHTANLSRDSIISKNRDTRERQETADRLTALEVEVGEAEEGSD